MVDEIVNNRSKMIHCTFNPGPQLWDAETELNKHRSHPREVWGELRSAHKELFYWRQLGRKERFHNLVHKKEILPYKSEDEYFSD